MAASFTAEPVLMDYSGARHKVVILDGNLGAYATNGVAITPAQFGLAEFTSVRITPKAAANILLYSFEYVWSTGKVVGLTNADGAEIANATDLSGVSLRFEVKGV